MSDAGQDSSGFLFASTRNQLLKCGFDISSVTPATQVRPLRSWRRRSVGIQVCCAVRASCAGCSVTHATLVDSCYVMLT